MTTVSHSHFKSCDKTRVYENNHNIAFNILVYRWYNDRHFKYAQHNILYMNSVSEKLNIYEEIRSNNFKIILNIQNLQNIIRFQY